MPSFSVHAVVALIITCASTIFLTSCSNITAWIACAAIVLCCSIFANLVFNCYIYPQISPLNHIPRVSQLPLLETFFSDGRSQWFSTNVPNKGFLRCYGFLHDEYLVATNIATVRELLIDRAYDWVKPASQMELLKLIIGNGLVSLEGNAHKRARRLLQPSFTSQHVNDLYPLFWEKACCLVDALKANNSGALTGARAVNLHDWIGRATLDVIGTVGLGLEFNAIGDPHTQVAASYRARYGEKPSAATRLILRFVPISLAKKYPTRRLKDLLETNETIKKHLSVILQEKKVLLEKGTLEDKDIFSVMIRAKSMKDSELIDHAITLVAAGQDTTAFVLSCLIFEVARRPDLQKIVREEIKTAIDFPSNIAPTPAQIRAVPHLEAIIMETLRLYPAIDCTPRVCLKTNTPSLVAGERIPKGTAIVIPLRDINRLEENWSNSSYDPEQWHPERWLSQNEPTEVTDGGATDSWSFMPFSRGSKNCIGEKFARAEMAVLLVKLLGQFELKLCGEHGLGAPPSDLEVFYSFTGALRTGIWASLEEVDATT